MIFPSNRVRIVVATKPVDFRRQHDGLVAHVKSALRRDATRLSDKTGLRLDDQRRKLHIRRRQNGQGALSDQIR